MSVCPLLTVFGLLPCRATTVSTGDILFLLGLGLYLVVFFARATTATKRNTILQNVLKVLLSCSHSCLMMEKANTGECHGDAVFVASHDHMIVAHRAAGLGNELHTALMGTLDIVAEGEERI